MTTMMMMMDLGSPGAQRVVAENSNTSLSRLSLDQAEKKTANNAKWTFSGDRLTSISPTVLLLA